MSTPVKRPAKVCVCPGCRQPVYLMLDDDETYGEIIHATCFNDNCPEVIRRRKETGILEAGSTSVSFYVKETQGLALTKTPFSNN